MEKKTRVGLKLSAMENLPISWNSTTWNVRCEKFILSMAKFISMHPRNENYNEFLASVWTFLINADHDQLMKYCTNDPTLW